MYDTEKHQIFTFQKLKPLNIFAISLKKLTKTCRFLLGPQRTTKKRKSLHILYFTAGFQLYSHLYLYLCKNNSSNNTSSQPKLEFSVYWQELVNSSWDQRLNPPKKTTHMTTINMHILHVSCTSRHTEAAFTCCLILVGLFTSSRNCRENVPHWVFGKVGTQNLLHMVENSGFVSVIQAFSCSLTCFYVQIFSSLLSY